MKYKGNKFGLRTGNTFHFGRQALLHKTSSRDQNVFVKSFNIAELPETTSVSHSERLDAELLERFTAATSTLLDDGGVPLSFHQTFPRSTVWPEYSGVTMSLNKRKRWLLPDIVAGVIDDMKDETVETWPRIRLTLTERLIVSHEEQNVTLKALKNLADIVCYRNSEAASSPAVSRTHKTPVVRRQKFSFYTDLRQNAVGNNNNNNNNKSCVSRKQKLNQRRTNTLGVQRIDVDKSKRSGVKGSSVPLLT